MFNYCVNNEIKNGDMNKLVFYEFYLILLEIMFQCGWCNVW